MKNTGRINYEGMLYFANVLLGNKQVRRHYSVPTKIPASRLASSLLLGILIIMML
jgi:hypothetical protein